MFLVWLLAAAFVHAVDGVQASGPPVCVAIARPLVAPVTYSRRDDAERLLGGKTALQLTDGQAAALLEERLSRDSLARTLVGGEISRRRKQRADALDHQIGSWGGTDADELADLIAAERSLISSPARPFLFRAVRGFEGTGSFRAEACGDRLEIHHGSLGTNRPPPASVPVVIFLKQQPAHVHSDYSVIE